MEGKSPENFLTARDVFDRLEKIERYPAK